MRPRSCRLLTLFVVTCILGCATNNSTPTKATIRAQDGLPLVVESAGKGDTTLLFLHGWTGDRSWWKHQVAPFSSDYRVVTLDQAGHGESGKNRTNWTVASLAADVETVVNQLRLQRVILIGHSMGGPVALIAARRINERKPGAVLAVIGVDTLQNVEQARLPDEQAKGYIQAFQNDFKGTTAMLFKGMLPENTDPQLRELLVAGSQSQDPAVAIPLMRDLFQLDQRTLLQQAKVPVRCINAAPGSFQFATPTAVDTNRKYADFNAVIIQGTGHFPMLEKPTELNRKLREVLEEFTPSR